MAAKLLLCTLLAVFALQELNAQFGNLNLDPIKDVVNKVLKADLGIPKLDVLQVFNKVREALQQTTLRLDTLRKSALGKIEAVFEPFKTKCKALLGNTLKKLQGIVKTVKEKLKLELQARAKNGKSIKQCLKVAKESVAKLEKHTSGGLENFLQDQVVQTDARVEQVTLLVKRGVEVANRAEGNFAVCSKGKKKKKAVGCLEKEALKTKQESLQIMSLIDEDVINTELQIAKAVNEFPAFVVKELVRANETGEAIVKAFVTCAAGKINKQ